MATRVVTYKLMPSINSYGWPVDAFQSAVRATWTRFYESIANVRFAEVPWEKSANVSINVKEIYIGNWQHGRGTVSGTTIWLHSGWVAPGHSPYTKQGFWWQAFSSLEGMQQVLAHELGHHRVMAWGGNSAHCKNGTCTFSLNAGAWWCGTHLAKVQRKLGKKPAWLLLAGYGRDEFCSEVVRPDYV